MPAYATLVTQLLRAKLEGDGGIAFYLEEAAGRTGARAPVLGPTQIRSGGVGADIADRSPVPYPAFYVSCERLTNHLKEKFRVFSGTARMAIEVRETQDRAEELENQLQCSVEALLSVLHGARGDWGQGVYFAGGYEVVYGSVKQGGRNYLKTAKVTLDVDVSSD